ncbi:MAG: T9SS type A sorting domain-containing protein [candidate division Zixibacteria bacterium]|nr:T9SS type A sorting domain-containing protein [candidate division Zixibacteria bacterium]
MRKNLLLIVLVFSLVLFFSTSSPAQVNEYSLVPVDLEVHPCTGGGTVEVDIYINTVDNISAFVVPLYAGGTSNPVLDTALTGSLGFATTYGFNPPSIVNYMDMKIVNETGPPGDPLLFVGLSMMTAPLSAPANGLFCKMFYTVDGPGTLTFTTAVHSTGGAISMVKDDGNPGVINWPAAGEVGAFDVVREAEVAPVVNCPAYLEYFAGDIIPIDISATDGGGTAIQGIFLSSVLPGGSGGFSGTNPWVYTWNSLGVGEGLYDLIFGVYDECETTYCTTQVKIVETVGFIQIGTVTGEPCELVEVPVLLKATVEFGAFDLYIEFDPTLLYFKGVERGAGLPQGWEFFTYRQLPCPSCGCCKYKLQLLGLYDIKDAHQGVPIGVSEDYLEIAVLKFQIACDENLRRYDLNICFEFDDGICSENTFSSVDGYTLYASDNEDFFNFNDCPVQDHEVNPVINKLHFDLFAPPGTMNPEGRACGGVLVGTVIKARGDINMNHIAYDPGDLTLFSSYFIYGEDVFIINPAQQIAATDINADGHPLSLSDFILMIRIMLGDATAIPKTTPGDVSIYAETKGAETKISTNANLGAVLFVFDGEGTVSSDLKFEQGVVNGKMRVLVYMSNSDGFSGQLLTVNGVSKFSAEAVDNFGRPVQTTLVSKAIPTAFALSPNYPNPFNPTTNFSIALPVDCKVSLKIYNVAGQLVRTLVNETMSAGHHTVTWDGTNSNSEKVASGVYFYKLNAGDFSKTMKMVMTK